MTLFLTKEYWALESDNDQYGNGCLALCNIDLSEDGKCKYSNLRILKPTSRNNKTEDLLLEQDVNRPILQIACGQFIGGYQNPVIALLHPRELSIYKLLRKDIANKDSSKTSESYYELILNQRKQLGIEESHFTAYNMCCGFFGKQTSQEHICIQGMDGQLLFYEQNNLLAHKQMNKVYLPGPMCYISDIDCLIHSSSDMFLSCYKYKTLIQFDSAKDYPNSEWSCNLGDFPICINYGRYSEDLIENQFDIIVLCEHHIFVIGDSGLIKNNFRINYHPSTMLLFRSISNGNDSILVTAFDKRLFVYYHNQIKWCANMGTFLPVQVQICNFFGVNGMICGLQENGRLSIMYLGTKPATVTNMIQSSKSIDPQQMEKEYYELMTIIRRKQQINKVEVKPLELTIKYPKTINENIPEEIKKTKDMARDYTYNNIISTTITLLLKNLNGFNVNKINIAISCSDAFLPFPQALTIASLPGDSTPVTQKINFVSLKQYIPTYLDFFVSVSYNSSSNELQAIYERGVLPLFQAVEIIPPVTKASYKFDIITSNNSVAIPVIGLFRDMSNQLYLTDEIQKGIMAAGSSIITFQYFSGEKCSIIVSKNGGKYRIQGSSLPCLYVITSEFIKRINAYQKVQGKDPIKIEYQDALPLGDYFNIIDHHLEKRKILLKLFDELNDLSHQFRAIQKLLLIRYKQKNPSLLNNLDVLLYKTINRIKILGDIIIEQQDQLKIATHDLEAATSLIICLISWTFHLKDEAVNILKYHLSPTIDSSFEGKWEEETSASLVFLFRTVLNKNKIDNAVVNQSMEIPENNDSLKQYIKLLCDKLLSGLALTKDIDSK